MLMHRKLLPYGVWRLEALWSRVQGLGARLKEGTEGSKRQ